MSDKCQQCGEIGFECKCQKRKVKIEDFIKDFKAGFTANLVAVFERAEKAKKGKDD